MSPPRPIPPALLIATALVAGGCAGPPTPAADGPRRLTDAEREEFRAAWGTGVQPRAVQRVTSTAVASGRAPLSYVTEQAGSAWVTDNVGRQWGPVEVPARAIVRIAAETGVLIGGQKFAVEPGAGTFTIHLAAPPELPGRSSRQGGTPPRR